MTNNIFETVPVRAYSKQELAKLYAPELTKKSAGKRFAYWLKYCKPLWEELQKTEYNPLQRILTPLQVELIFKYLGEP